MGGILSIEGDNRPPVRLTCTGKPNVSTKDAGRSFRRRHVRRAGRESLDSEIFDGLDRPPVRLTCTGKPNVSMKDARGHSSDATYGELAANRSAPRSSMASMTADAAVTTGAAAHDSICGVELRSVGQSRRCAAAGHDVRPAAEKTGFRCRGGIDCMKTCIGRSLRRIHEHHQQDRHCLCCMHRFLQPRLCGFRIHFISTRRIEILHALCVRAYSWWRNIHPDFRLAQSASRHSAHPEFGQSRRKPSSTFGTGRRHQGKASGSRAWSPATC